LDEDVYEIIVAVGTVMKIDAEGPLQRTFSSRQVNIIGIGISSLTAHLKIVG